MTHREAVESTLASVSLSGRYDALVALVRAVADQVDTESEISARMSAVYLSALRNLSRAIDQAETEKPPTAKTTLSKLRAQHGATG